MSPTKEKSRSKKSMWETDARPMGVSPDDVLIGWFKQPGNFDRFDKADSDKKKAGRAKESKIDVARDILVLLQNAGFTGFVLSGIVVRGSLWVRKYRNARRLDRAGASRVQVERAFNHYFELVDHVQRGRTGDDEPASPLPLSTMSSSHGYENFSTPRESPALMESGQDALCELSGENIIRNQQRQRRPVSRYNGQQDTALSAARSQRHQSRRGDPYPAVSLQPSRQYHDTENLYRLIDQHNAQTNHILDMHNKQLNRLIDQYQDLVSELSRSHRSQQMQMQTSLTASLIERMKDAGFSKEEIASNMTHLQPQSPHTTPTPAPSSSSTGERHI